MGVGKTVYIAGAGPVGICCAASCILLGAAVVVVGDVNRDRLSNAQRLGPVVRTLDVGQLDRADPQALSSRVRQIVGHSVVDCACDCVGYKASGLGPSKEENKAGAALHACFAAVKTGGAAGIPGIYLPYDPKGELSTAPAERLSIYCGPAVDCRPFPVSPSPTGSHELYKQGLMPLKFGLAWVKGLELSHRATLQPRTPPLAPPTSPTCAHSTPPLAGGCPSGGCPFPVLVETGQCPVMRYHRELLISILHSRVSVSDALRVQVISLEQAIVGEPVGVSGIW